MPTANEPITHRESALWADMRRVQGDELFYAYMDNQAIVIPETIDAIRAGRTSGAADESIVRTNTALGIESY